MTETDNGEQSGHIEQREGRGRARVYSCDGRHIAIACALRPAVAPVPLLNAYEVLMVGVDDLVSTMIEPITVTLTRLNSANTHDGVLLPNGNDNTVEP